MKIFYLLFVSAGMLLQCSSANTSDYEMITSTQQRNDTIGYAKQIAAAKDSVRAFITAKQGPYYPKEFDDKTEVFIDTLLFSPQRDKILFLVITKNTDDKLLEKGSSNQWHFDASCFIGRLTNKGKWDIAWFNALNITRFESFVDASRRIRELYFEELSNIEKDEGKKSLYKYNIGEKEFWYGPVWTMYFGK